MDTGYGLTDGEGWSCLDYANNPRRCESGNTDDEDFSAGVMCCACGGGEPSSEEQDIYCVNAHADCIIVLYTLRGVSEELMPKTILGANTRLKKMMNMNFANSSYWWSN